MTEQMQPQRQVLRLHGRTHGTGGADRRGGGFPAYEWENIGAWLYSKTSDPVPGDLDATGTAPGVLFDTSHGVTVTSPDGTASFYVIGTSAEDDVSVSLGGIGPGSPLFLDGKFSLSSFLEDFFDFEQADGSGHNSQFSLNTGEGTLAGTDGIDIVSNAETSISPFPVSFGVNSVQVAAGDDTRYGTVVLEAFDNQGTPTYTEYFVGYVEFNPNPYAYNGQTAQILGGQKFTIVGSDGSPIFQVDALEQGGAVHIKSGGTVVANL
jgi:hypothetical protein